MVDEINEHIEAFKSNGLIFHLIAKYTNRKFTNAKLLDTGPTPLKLEHLQALFDILLLYGLAVSTACFLIETVIFLLRKKWKNSTAISQDKLP